ncbi:helix-turn-helix transcriptional regulator [Pseudoflavitalea sp. G-6-1-2]|uniref:winged helix-turn-helix transcriptional regulator n=1 Tax=Pseudoflavitalea sp. G-6-1-2 TaxID=2728841 RepID=UPI00146E6CFE|nr:helix-turn-helix domain-containing protein [Pseudoflavitalea sp. G-6-1-2]NML22186.1 helix-turn-helix transcriptional regulator [Pseudoflavitalea sp. G-6-1-2]
MRKKNSTNSINEEALKHGCGMSYTLSVLGGRWKPAILFTLLKGKMRYSELRKNIAGVSERMLVAQLRELEDDGMVKRIIYPEVPPRVEYELTTMGMETAPMLRHMSAWGNKHRQIIQSDDSESVHNLPAVGVKKTTASKKEAVA